ncbi:MAG: hypothetical protein IJ598_11275 [Ruminococcus sp.]|nr:hypothetical protein [Ruminococcus sp.]
MKKPIIAALAAAIALTSSCLAVSAAQTDDFVAAPTAATQPAAVSFPEVTGFENVTDGTAVSWKAYPNAARYGLFFWNGESWKGVGTTSSLSLTHHGLKSGETYRYTVRALNANGDFISDFNRDGYENLFLAPPEVTVLTNSEAGVTVEWTARKGAEKYRVYRKTANTGWKRVGDTDDTRFVDETVASGTEYRYTVRCITADGSDWTSDYTDGKTVRFVRAPLITDFENTATGTRIYWKKCDGAAKYRVFMLDREGIWRGLGTTSATSFVNDGLLSGESYTYTVRCMDSDGEFISGYDHTGKSYTFLTAPKVNTLTPVATGIEVTWGKLEGAVNYRVYRKTGNNDWTRVGDTTDAALIDTKAPSGTTVSYTVRAITADGSDWTSYYTAGKSITYVKAPVITGFENTADGTEIRWSKCDGAAKYRVFALDAEGNWRGLGNTASESFVNTKVQSGVTTTYTVRCLDKNGDFVSTYDKEGKSFIFLKPPVISSLKVTENGVEVKWNALSGAEKYRVYRKTGNGSWTRLADTAAASYTDVKAVSGAVYTYTVRAVTADGSDWTSDYTSGKSVTFVKTPAVTSFENAADGVKLSWGKCDGAYKYGVFYLAADGNWKGISSTTSTSFVDTTVKNGETRTYTVRCLDKNSDFVSAFNHTGWATRYFAPPAIASVAKAASGNTISWNAVDGAAGYRLYRRTLTSGWARLFDGTAATAYTDDAKSNTAYAYTLRLLDSKGELISSYIDDANYYYNGKIADGTLNIDGKSYVFHNGKIRQGYVKIGSDTYYFNSKGEMLKDCLVGSTAEGFRYADKNGKIDFNFTGVTKNAYGYWYVEKGKLDFSIRTAVSYGGSDWNILDAKAVKVTSEYDRTLHRALKLIDKVCDRGMSKGDKLWKMFRYIQNAYVEKNPRIPHYHGDGWELIYANDMLVNGVGNCMSYGAEFAFIAKGLGYNNVYACNSGGHGWCEIEGKVYDPEWGRHFFDHTYFGIDYYNNPTKVAYSGILGGPSWMRVKI